MLSERVLARWRCLVAYMKALDLLHRAMRAKLYRRIVVAIETAIKVGAYYILYCLLSPWRPLGQYGVSSRPMAASSGFWCSPGHAALGNATCIASTPPHGHQNGLRRRCIRSPPPPFSLGVIIAKDHGMVHLN